MWCVVRSERSMLDECKSQQVTQSSSSNSLFLFESRRWKWSSKCTPAEVWFMAKAFGTSRALNTNAFPWGLDSFCPDLTFIGIGDSCSWHTVSWQMGVVVWMGLPVANRDPSQDTRYRIYIRSSRALSGVYHVDQELWVCCTVSHHYLTLVFRNRHLH